MQLKDRKYIVVDILTTGSDINKHQILEVSIVVFLKGKVLDSFKRLIKHDEYVLSTEVMKCNRIDIMEHDEVAKDSRYVLEEILEFFNNNVGEAKLIPIGQNIDLILGFLKEFFKNRIADFNNFISIRKLDIMQIALLKNLEGKIIIEEQGLDSILKSLEMEIPRDRQNTLSNCYVEYEILQKLLKL